MITTKELESLGLAAPAGPTHAEQTLQELREVKQAIAEGISQRMQAEWPDINRRLRIGEAAEWIRCGAPGRALEVLETILSDYEAQDRKGH